MLLGAPTQSLEWTVDDLASSPEGFDCGPIDIFFHTEILEPLDADLFEWTADGEENTFDILQTVDTSKIGNYDIYYSATYAMDETPIITIDDPFEVSIVQSCDKAISITAPQLVDQEYTITGEKKKYRFDPFITQPAGC
jgi:hypothetical protein